MTWVTDTVSFITSQVPAIIAGVSASGAAAYGLYYKYKQDKRSDKRETAVDERERNHLVRLEARLEECEVERIAQLRKNALLEGHNSYLESEVKRLKGL